jgi:two-component system response regulator
MPAIRPVLLVEDNANDEALTLRAFARCQLANPVVVARDGVEALDYVFRRGEHAGRDAASDPAVVLLDIKLPRIDGLEVLRAIRADPATRTLPVVIFTSSGEEKDLIQGYSLGTNSYVKKPIEFDAFTRAVAQLGLYWLVLNERPGQPPGPAR